MVNFKLLQGDMIEYDDKTYYTKGYCFDAYENSGQIRFNGVFCEANITLLYALNILCEIDFEIFFTHIYSPFLFSVVIIICILLIIPLWIYFMIPELRNEFHGRICIAQLIIQIFMAVLYPLSQTSLFYRVIILRLFIVCATFSSNIFTSMMVYDIFQSFR